MSASKESLIGSMVDGRYLIEEELGVGGIGAVYLARDLKVLGRNVVVKVLLEESFQNEYVVKKFRQEAEALSRVDHPNIVGILDFGEMEGSQPYLVLQFVDGVSLRTILQPGGIDLERSAQIIRQVAYALTAAHDKGILHRDLKPDNIMLQTIGGEEHVIVIDFGIAQIQDSVIAPKTVVTATAGTISYMSPEQLSAGTLSPASDTYALSVIAYELVTGHKPFNPKSPFQLLEMQRAGLEVMPRSLRPELPESAQQVILKALSFNPEERYQRTRDFGTAFCRALTEAPGVSANCSDATNTGVNSAVSSAQTTGGINPTTPQALNGRSIDTTPTRVYEEDVAEPVASLPQQVSAPVSAPAEAPSKSSKLPFVILAVVLLMIGLTGGLAFAIWRLTRPATQPIKQVNTDSGPVAPPSLPEITPPTGPAAPAEIALNYSLTVQKMRDGKEYKEPFQSTGREIFENGWQFRLNVSTLKSGYLYLLNEGLNDQGAVAYTVLFPTGNSAQLAANQTVQIPEAPLYAELTGKAGTEKIWMIWSDAPVPEMEAVRGVVNNKDQGEITNPAQISSIREFLAKHTLPNLEVIEDKLKKQTSIKATSNLVVHLAELEHH